MYTYTVVVISRPEAKTVAVKVAVGAVLVVRTSSGVIVTVNGPSPTIPWGFGT
jgi:hypothetical protein